MSSLRIYTLKCPSCGGGLKVRESIEHFACSFCGASVRVEREGGIITLTTVTEALEGVKKGTDRTAAELAIIRLTKEIDVTSAEVAAFRKELDEEEIQVHYARNRRPVQYRSLLINHFVGGLIQGAIMGIVIAVPVGWMFPSASFWTAAIITAIFCGGHMLDPMRRMDRRFAESDESDDQFRKDRAKRKGEEVDASLPSFRNKVSGAEERLSDLQMKLESARAIVNGR